MAHLASSKSSERPSASWKLGNQQGASRVINRPPPAAKTGDNNYLYLERAQNPEGTHDNVYAALRDINIV